MRCFLQHKAGDRIAISAPNSNSKGLERNSLVTVLDYNPNNWNQVWTDIVGLTSNEQFGFALALSADGTTFAAGVPQSDGNESNLGTVRVFEHGNNEWTQKGRTIKGVANNDRFGRSVAISNNGNRLAASSYFHNQQRGQVRLLEFLGDWTNVEGEMEGINVLERFGFGVFGMSMTGDRTRVAAGTPLADNISGQSTGLVRVYQQTPASSNFLSGAPSALPSFLPSARPSLSQIPSWGPSHTINPSATTFPTWIDAVSPAVALDKFSWDLEPIGEVYSVFDEESKDEEIHLQYNSLRNSTVRVYEYDCTIPVASNVVAASKAITVTSPVHGVLDVKLDLRQDTVVGSSIWFKDRGANQTHISLCVGVDLELHDGDTVMSVNFHEQKIQIYLDLNQISQTSI